MARHVLVRIPAKEGAKVKPEIFAFAVILRTKVIDSTVRQGLFAGAALLPFRFTHSRMITDQVTFLKGQSTA